MDELIKNAREDTEKESGDPGDLVKARVKESESGEEKGSVESNGKEETRDDRSGPVSPEGEKKRSPPPEEPPEPPGEEPEEEEEGEEDIFGLGTYGNEPGESGNPGSRERSSGKEKEEDPSRKRFRELKKEVKKEMMEKEKEDKKAKIYDPEEEGNILH